MRDEPGGRVKLGDYDPIQGGLKMISFGGRRANPVAPSRICVIHHPRGRWEVISPGRERGIACETLDDARRIAYLSVAPPGDCEVIVRDAYHRVLEHGLIRTAGSDGDGGPDRGA